MIGKKTRNDLPQPLSLRRDRLMHSPPQLFLNCLEPRAYAIPPALPLELEIALTGLAADEREAQKVKGLRLAEPTLTACDRGKATKLNQRVRATRSTPMLACSETSHRPRRRTWGLTRLEEVGGWAWNQKSLFGLSEHLEMLNPSLSPKSRFLRVSSSKCWPPRHGSMTARASSSTS